MLYLFKIFMQFSSIFSPLTISATPGGHAERISAHILPAASSVGISSDSANAASLIGMTFCGLISGISGIFMRIFGILTSESTFFSLLRSADDVSGENSSTT